MNSGRSRSLIVAALLLGALSIPLERGQAEPRPPVQATAERVVVATDSVPRAEMLQMLTVSTIHAVNFTGYHIATALALDSFRRSGYFVLERGSTSSIRPAVRRVPRSRLSPLLLRRPFVTRARPPAALLT